MKQLLPPLSRGCYVMRFRFMDEARGERYFDSEYAIRRLDKFKFNIVGPMNYRGYINYDVKTRSEIGAALRVGDTLSVSLEKLNRRGRCFVDSRLVRVVAVVPQDNGTVDVEVAGG